jgi:transposase-like protein
LVQNVLMFCELTLVPKLNLHLSMEDSTNTTQDPESTPQSVRRYFSIEARKAIVTELDQGLSIAEASRKYTVSRTTLYNWLNAYSVFYQKKLVTVVEHESDFIRAKRLEQELIQLKQHIAEDSVRIRLLEVTLELANEKYNTDLKKSLDPSPYLSSLPNLKPKE